jgi:hypothetical protein
MRRHWWWRPGWRPGRRLYAWHLTFGDQTVSRGLADLRQVVGDYQARLAELPGLDLVPVGWLHLTVQAIGFVDEVDAGDLERIVAAVRRRCAALAPVRLTLGPAVLIEEGVWLRVAPQRAVRQGRAAVRAGIAEVWGAARAAETAGGSRRTCRWPTATPMARTGRTPPGLPRWRRGRRLWRSPPSRRSRWVAIPTCTNGRRSPRSRSGPGQFVEFTLGLSVVIKRAKRSRSG